MGNLLSKFLLQFRRIFLRRTLPSGRRQVVFPVGSDDGPPDRNHPAAPASVLRPGLSHLDRVWLPSVSHTQRRRTTTLMPPGMDSSLRSLPLVTWRDPPKEHVLSASNSRTFKPSKTINIPPPGQKFSLPHSPPERTIKSVMPVSTNTIPLPCSKEMGEKIQEEPKKGMVKNEGDLVETNRLDYQYNHRSNEDQAVTAGLPKNNRVVVSDKCGSGPPNRDPESSMNESASVSPMRCPSGSQVVTSSGSPAGNILPPPKPDWEAAVLPVRSPGCSLLPEIPIKEVRGENRAQIHSNLLRSGKEMHSPKPAAVPPASSPLLGSARLHERKIPMPPSLPLPPLMWDGGELPVPCTLPCFALAKNPDTWKNPTCQWNKILEDKTKVMADCSATHSAPSFTPPAGALPLATHADQVPATANSADLSTRRPTLSVPTLPLTQSIAQNKGHTVPHFPPPIRAHSLPLLSTNPILRIPPTNKNGGRLHLVLALTSPISHLSTPDVTSILSHQLRSCRNESQTPLCGNHPPASSLPTPPPVPSDSLPLSVVPPINCVAIPSTSAISPARLTCQQPTLDRDVTDMDTTPPSEAFLFTAAPGRFKRSRRYSRACCRVENPPNLVASSTGPPAAKYLHLSPYYAGGPQTTSQPTSGICCGRKKKTSLISATVGTNSVRLVKSAVTHSPVSSTSVDLANNSEPMDTTPPL